MSTIDLEKTAAALVAGGKGILAADETVPTVTRRLARVNVPSTSESRRAYRELFFTTPGVAEWISGVIMHDETIRQQTGEGVPLRDLLARQGIAPGIKVDAGVVPLAGHPGEHITQGLDGLRQRLERYRDIGARFAKWRAVFTVGDASPTSPCIRANAHLLARYAALCHEQGLVPIVEPEVLMDGAHTLERCEQVTGCVLDAVCDALHEHRVLLEGVLLKPNMVMPGKECAAQASVAEVATATVRCLRRHAPAALAGVVFLSGGQDPVRATQHLSAINQLDVVRPWKLSFSYGRALQDEALEAWRGRSDRLAAAQRAFQHRATCDKAAALGAYTSSMENQPAVA